MNVEMTPILQEITDGVKTIPNVLDFGISKVPANLLEQVGDKDCLLFKFLIKIENETDVQVNFVVPSVVYNIKDSWKYIPINELIHCGCDRIRVPEVVGPNACYCVEGAFKNIGITTYYVRPDDQYLVRLIEQQPKTIDLNSPELQNLYNVFENLPRVDGVRFEEVLDDNLKYDDENYILVKCDVEIRMNTNYAFTAISDRETENGRIIPFNFILPESVYGDISLHESAANNLISWVKSIEEGDNGNQSEAGTV